MGVRMGDDAKTPKNHQTGRSAGYSQKWQQLIYLAKNRYFLVQFGSHVCTFLCIYKKSPTRLFSLQLHPAHPRNQQNKRTSQSNVGQYRSDLGEGQGEPALFFLSLFFLFVCWLV